MAKELPYYQFEVAEYLAGDIMTCSLESQGLFSIIKCLYWQKECHLSTKQILKRYDKEELLGELVEEGAIKIDSEGNLNITFLDTQYQLFKDRREKLSNAGRKGGQSQAKATLKPPLSEAKATPKHIEESRVDKNREEESKVNKDKEIVFAEWLDYRKEIKKPIKANKTLTGLIDQFNKATLKECEYVVNNSITNQWTGLFWDKYIEKKQATKKPWEVNVI